MIDREGFHPPLGRRICRELALELGHIGPILGLRVEAKSEFVGGDELLASCGIGADRAPDAPQGLAEIVARAVLGGIWPEDPGQSLAAMSGSGVEDQVGEKRLGRTRRDLNELAVEINAELAQQPDI